MIKIPSESPVLDKCPKRCKHATFHYCGNGTHCDKHCVCPCRLCEENHRPFRWAHRGGQTYWVAALQISAYDSGHWQIGDSVRALGREANLEDAKKRAEAVYRAMVAPL